MTKDTTDLIVELIHTLQEDVRSLRAEVHDYRKELNGRLRTLESFRWKLVGVAAAVSTLASLVGALFLR